MAASPGTTPPTSIVVGASRCGDGGAAGARAADRGQPGRGAGGAGPGARARARDARRVARDADVVRRAAPGRDDRFGRSAARIRAWHGAAQSRRQPASDSGARDGSRARPAVRAGVRAAWLGVLEHRRHRQRHAVPAQGVRAARSRDRARTPLHHRPLLRHRHGRDRKGGRDVPALDARLSGRVAGIQRVGQRREPDRPLRGGGRCRRARRSARAPATVRPGQSHDGAHRARPFRRGQSERGEDPGAGSGQRPRTHRALCDCRFPRRRGGADARARRGAVRPRRPTCSTWRPSPPPGTGDSRSARAISKRWCGSIAPRTTMPQPRTPSASWRHSMRWPDSTTRRGKPWTRRLHCLERTRASGCAAVVNALLGRAHETRPSSTRSITTGRWRPQYRHLRADRADGPRARGARHGRRRHAADGVGRALRAGPGGGSASGDRSGPRLSRRRRAAAAAAEFREGRSTTSAWIRSRR